MDTAKITGNSETDEEKRKLTQPKMKRTQCPKCASEGRDNSEDNLAVYPDGGMYCHAGHGYIRSRDYKIMDSDKTSTSNLDPRDALDNPIGNDPARKIDKGVLSEYGVRVSYDTETGKPKRVYYPYYDSAGTLTGVKIRIWPKERFLIAGKLTGVFGKNTCQGEAKRLIITEGEEDALAARQLFASSGDVVHCVSLANGANEQGKLDACILNDQVFFARYQRIYLCLDTDAPGKATSKRLGNWLCSFAEWVAIVELPLKDFSDCLVQGKEAEARAAVKKARKHTPEGIIDGKDINLADILRPRPKGVPTPFKELDNKLKGLRRGELVTVCAGSGIGKSTLVRELAYHMVTHHNLSVCHITLENAYEDTAASYLAMQIGIPPPVFLAHAEEYKPEQLEEAAVKTIRNMYFFDHFGSIEKPSLIEKIRYYARCGVDFIILDHLSMVVSGLDTNDERRDIDRIMTDLAALCVETGVGIISVVHLKRKTSEGESYNHGGEVSLTDLRGSAALEQLSWSVVAMERNQQAEDGEEDFSVLRVLKNRTWGYLGKAGRVRYDHGTGRLCEVEDVRQDEPHDIDKPEEEIAA